MTDPASRPAGRAGRGEPADLAAGERMWGAIAFTAIRQPPQGPRARGDPDGGPHLARGAPRSGAGAVSPAMTLEAVERQHIIAVLGEVAGESAVRAERPSTLGLKPSTLEVRMRKLGVTR